MPLLSTEDTDSWDIQFLRNGVLPGGTYQLYQNLDACDQNGKEKFGIRGFGKHTMLQVHVLTSPVLTCFVVTFQSSLSSLHDDSSTTVSKVVHSSKWWSWATLSKYCCISGCEAKRLVQSLTSHSEY